MASRIEKGDLLQIPTLLCQPPKSKPPPLDLTYVPPAGRDLWRRQSRPTNDGGTAGTSSREVPSARRNLSLSVGKGLLQGGEGGLALAAVDDDVHADFAGAHHVDVDAGLGQRLKHADRDAGVAPHADS